MHMSSESNNHSSTHSNEPQADAPERAPFSSEPLPLVHVGDPVLRQVCDDWDGSDTPELRELVERMVATMHDAPGVGVAAPQVGVNLRLAVLEDLYEIPASFAEAREREKLELMVVLNPSYEPIGDRTATHYEGCLSMPGYTAAVERPADIRATWQDLDGNLHIRDLSGWQARIFQHETDHLAGIIYIDKAHIRSICTDENYAGLWAEPTPHEVREALQF